MSPVSVWYLEKFHPSRTLARDLGRSQNWGWSTLFHIGWGSGKAYSFNQKTPEEDFRAINWENITGRKQGSGIVGCLHTYPERHSEFPGMGLHDSHGLVRHSVLVRFASWPGMGS